MAIKVEKETTQRRVKVADMTAGDLVRGTMYDESGHHVVAPDDFYIVTHVGTLVSLTCGQVSCNSVLLACYEVYDGTLTVRRKG